MVCVEADQTFADAFSSNGFPTVSEFSDACEWNPRTLPINYLDYTKYKAH